MTMNIFLSLTRYRVSIILPLTFFSSDQRLVSQCPVQPSCRRHEVPGWKTDCAYPGRYYIYLQIYCITQGRVYVRANNRVITMFQSPTTLSTMYVGGVFNLTAGDVITFRSAYANFRVFMNSIHTYFGAYLIWKSTNCCVAKSSFLLIKRFCCKQHGDCTTTLQV